MAASTLEAAISEIQRLSGEIEREREHSLVRTHSRTREREISRVRLRDGELGGDRVPYVESTRARAGTLSDEQCHDQARGAVVSAARATGSQGLDTSSRGTSGTSLATQPHSYAHTRSF